jgi:hypothetical protein
MKSVALLLRNVPGRPKYLALDFPPQLKSLLTDPNRILPQWWSEDSTVLLMDILTVNSLAKQEV